MITIPTLLLDEKRCKANILTMADKAKRLGLDFRPHFKTHQSLEIGRWFKEVGVDKIAVSSFDMAMYFSKEWDDITVAFPVNILEIDKINDLAKRVILNLLVESKDSIEFLGKNVEGEVSLFIKIDVGTNRTGVQPDNHDEIFSLIELIQGFDNLRFKGFLAHTGHTYQCDGESEINAVHNKAISILSTLKHCISDKYNNFIISLGDTPACSVSENFEGIDEIRPGNFVFFDVNQSYIGSCHTNQVAVAMACPIVSVHPDRNEITVYGGGIHFSKDRQDTPEYGTVYGLGVEMDGETWRDVIEGMYVRKLSQEHGVIKVPAEMAAQLKPGNLVYVLPVHSCMTVDLMQAYLEVRSGKTISARYKTYLAE